MAPFSNSSGNQYRLVVVDYASKWLEAIPSKMNDNRIVVKFLKKNIFSRFGIPRAIISENGTHFATETLMRKYVITHNCPHLVILKPMGR